MCVKKHSKPSWLGSVNIEAQPFVRLKLEPERLSDALGKSVQLEARRIKCCNHSFTFELCIFLQTTQHIFIRTKNKTRIVSCWVFLFLDCCVFGVWKR